jgi:hypothetical protein
VTVKVRYRNVPDLVERLLSWVGSKQRNLGHGPRDLQSARALYYFAFGG